MTKEELKLNKRRQKFWVKEFISNISRAGWDFEKNATVAARIADINLAEFDKRFKSKQQ